jgi:hypothetical protein
MPVDHAPAQQARAVEDSPQQGLSPGWAEVFYADADEDVFCGRSEALFYAVLKQADVFFSALIFGYSNAGGFCVFCGLFPA